MAIAVFLFTIIIYLEFKTRAILRFNVKCSSSNTGNKGIKGKQMGV